MSTGLIDRALLTFICFVAAAFTGCGASPSLRAIPPIEDEPGDPTRIGTVLTPGARERWREALDAYESAVAQGFTEAECASVIEGFEAADAAQGGTFTEAVYMMGVTRERCGRPDDARALYARALEMNDALCGARVALGIEHYRAGRIDQARTEFERAVGADSRCTEGYVNLAILQRRSPAEAAAALANLRRALAIDASYLPALDQMALLYLQQATAQGDGQPQARLLGLAEVVCRQAQLIDPDYAPLYNTWGLINVQQGNIVAALAKFERAFQLDDDLYEAFMNFGELTLSFRGYDDAAAAFSRAVELRGESYDAYLGLGAARRGLGEADAAQAAYERAIEIDQDRPEAYFNLGVLHQDYRDGEEATLVRAVSYYQQFVERAGTSPAFAPAVQGVTHECAAICPAQPTSGTRRRRTMTCTMGRIQQIEQNLCLRRELGAGGATPSGDP
jgi:tetratricopeptide (TPR) repeat protein